MSQTHPTGQAGLFTMMVRPARAVYVIAEGSRTGFRRAVQEATTRWGGACEPIMEVRVDGTVADEARLIINAANVDGVVNVDAQIDLAKAVAESFHREVVPIEEVDLRGTTMFTSHPTVLGLSPDTVDGNNGYVTPPADSELWQAAGAGDLTPEHEGDFRQGRIAMRRTRYDYEIVQAQLWGHTLLERTTAICCRCGVDLSAHAAIGA